MLDLKCFMNAIVEPETWKILKYRDLIGDERNHLESEPYKKINKANYTRATNINIYIYTNKFSNIKFVIIVDTTLTVNSQCCIFNDIVDKYKYWLLKVLGYCGCCYS